MKSFFLFLLAGSLAAAPAYAKYPEACRKLVDDVSNDISGAVTDTASPKDGTSTPPAAEVVAANPTSVPATIPAPAPDVAPAAPAASNWRAPAVFPSKEEWTWTTVAGDVYHNVKVVGMEQNFVTIIYTGGGRRISLTDLPPGLQKDLGYDPAAYAQATTARQNEVAATQQAAATGGPWEFEDYGKAVTQARLSGKRLLLYFTGSDWCPWCQKMDREILATSQFRQYAAQNFVMVTLDFPRNTPLSESLKQQNQGLAEHYNVTGYPTLLVTDASGKESSRVPGYMPTVDDLIAALK